MVSDLGQIEKRLERLEKDLKKMKTPELEKEFELLNAPRRISDRRSQCAKWK